MVLKVDRRAMKFLLFVFLFFCQAVLLAQEPLTIKVKKESDADKTKTEMDKDSIFFDERERAFYSKTSGYENRFKTMKQCNVTYASRKKNGTISMRKNKLSPAVEKLFDTKTKKMEIRFTEIILLPDSLNPKERAGTPITITVYRKLKFFRFYFGMRGSIITPFLTWRVVRTTVEYR